MDIISVYMLNEIIEGCDDDLLSQVVEISEYCDWPERCSWLEWK